MFCVLGTWGNHPSSGPVSRSFDSVFRGRTWEFAFLSDFSGDSSMHQGLGIVADLQVNGGGKEQAER